MSQSDFADLESPLSGEALVNTYLEPWRDALHSNHSGPSRPSYVTDGMIWVNTGSTPWVLNFYDGSDDIPLGTINTSTNQFTPSNRALWGGSTAGTANALTLTPTPALQTLVAGVVYDCLITTTNTSAAPTLNISGTGVKSIKCSQGAGKVNLPVGALQSGMIARIGYDGTDHILMNIRPYNQSANIATASTVNLNAATGDYLRLTGTTTINTITLAAGLQRTCVADESFTITDGSGTSPQGIVCPGAADIITAAGDCFIVRGEPSGTVRVVNYMRADGTSLNQSSVVTATAAATDSELDIELPGDFEIYEIDLLDVEPTTGGINLAMRVSIDDGVSYKNGASDYGWSVMSSTNSEVTSSDLSDSEINISRASVGTTTGEALSGNLRIYRPKDNSDITRFQWNIVYKTDPGALVNAIGSGVYENTDEITHIRFYFLSDTIQKAKIIARGINT